MATVVGQGARYGSPAELAAYAGVSVKTIRRLADADKVRKLRVGRRVVIPYEDLDAHILQPEPPRRPAMQATARTKTPGAPAPPRLRFDDEGHAIAPTEAELREEAERIRLALAEMDAIPDDPPGSDEEFWRAIDAGRPERPQFRGMY